MLFPITSLPKNVWILLFQILHSYQWHSKSRKKLLLPSLFQPLSFFLHFFLKKTYNLLYILETRFSLLSLQSHIFSEKHFSNPTHSHMPRLQNFQNFLSASSSSRSGSFYRLRFGTFVQFLPYYFPMIQMNQDLLRTVFPDQVHMAVAPPAHSIFVCHLTLSVPA